MTRCTVARRAKELFRLAADECGRHEHRRLVRDPHTPQPIHLNRRVEPAERELGASVLLFAEKRQLARIERRIAQIRVARPTQTGWVDVVQRERALRALG
jgi:hypothetical protein